MDSSEDSVSAHRDGPNGVLALRGRFHLELALELHKAALKLARTGRGVIVDRSQAEHLDGGAVQVLLALKPALEQGGGSLRMRGESTEVRKHLGWSGEQDKAPEAPMPLLRKPRRTVRKSPL
jgi:anti-anti-sigma regulatory factor